jgi:hypothetical protein
VKAKGESEVSEVRPIVVFDLKRKTRLTMWAATEIRVRSKCPWA